MESENHIGQAIKNVFRENNLTDNRITSATGFDQFYLSKVYTSRQIQPLKLYHFLFVINKNFNLNIEIESISKAKTANMSA
jgi:hypothetical protein